MKHLASSDDPATVLPVVSGTPDVGASGAYTEAGDVGYHKSMSNFQIQMIAIGGAVGTGLFLGLGSRLQAAGPALVLA